mmetsp:Transcript_40867/g.107996  ORF Transcript_40867/g.107996 Transcript_40867/m.107996 type:complete len:163 (+) Transcript_40867:1766-2254(+)
MRPGPIPPSRTTQAAWSPACTRAPSEVCRRSVRRRSVRRCVACAFGAHGKGARPDPVDEAAACTVERQWRGAYAIAVPREKGGRGLKGEGGLRPQEREGWCGLAADDGGLLCRCSELSSAPSPLLLSPGALPSGALGWRDDIRGTPLLAAGVDMHASMAACV